MVDFDDVGRTVIAGGAVGTLRRVLQSGDQKYALVRFDFGHEQRFNAENVETAQSAAYPVSASFIINEEDPKPEEP